VGVAGHYPTRGAELRDDAAAAATVASSAYASSASAYAFIAFAAYSASGASASAYTYASSSAASASASASSTAISSAVLDALAADADLIDQGVSAAVLAGRPLWLTEAPPRARQLWDRLERALFKENLDWKVWTDWYRARLEGRPTIEDLEVARVMIAEEIWKPANPA